MWPCGPAMAFRPGARPVHGAARPPTAGRAQDRPDPPQIRPAGAQMRWPWLGSSGAPRGRGWASARPSCTATMAAAAAAAREEWGRVEKNGGHAAGGREGRIEKEAHVPPTGGPGEDTRRRPARPRAVCFTPKAAQTWAADGSKADTKRTKVRLRPRAGPSSLSLLPQTDGDERIGSRGGVGQERVE